MLEKPLSQEDLLGIVALASTMDERLSKEFIPEEAQADDAIGNAQLEAWCQLVAKGAPRVARVGQYLCLHLINDIRIIHTTSILLKLHFLYGTILLKN